MKVNYNFFVILCRISYILGNWILEKIPSISASSSFWRVTHHRKRGWCRTSESSNISFMGDWTPNLNEIVDVNKESSEGRVTTYRIGPASINPSAERGRMQSDASDWCRLKGKMNWKERGSGWPQNAAGADPIITDAHGSGFLLCLYCFTAKPFLFWRKWFPIFILLVSFLHWIKPEILSDQPPATRGCINPCNQRCC